MVQARGRYRTDTNTDLLDRIAQLEARLGRLERTPSIPFTAIDKGAMVIKDGDGHTIVELGTTSDSRVGLRINNTSAEAQIRLGQLATTGYGLEIADATGHLVNLATLAFGLRSASVAATESLPGSASAYTNLTTSGPAVTVEVGDTGNCIIMLGAVFSPGGGTTAIMGVDIVGPTTRLAVAGSASDFDGAYLYSPSSPNTISAAFSRVQLQTGLAAGTYTITCKYRVAGANTCFWSNRNIVAIPF
jgi:hypothetical protein